MSFSDLLTKTLLQSLPGRGRGGIRVGSGLTLSRFWLQSDHVRLPGHVQTPDPPPQRLPAPGQRECPPRASLHQMAACPFLSRNQGPPWPSPRPPPPTDRSLPGLIWQGVGVGWGVSGQLLQQRDSCSPLLAWFPPSPPHRPQPVRDPIDATQGDDGHHPLYSRNFPEQLSADPATGRRWGEPGGMVSDGVRGPQGSQCIPSPPSPSLPS